MLYYFYRGLLEDYEQEIYDALAEGFRNFEYEVHFPTLNSFEQVKKIWQYVLWDDPSLFYLDSSIAATGYDDTFSIAHPEYVYSQSEADNRWSQIEAGANDCLDYVYQFETDYDMMVAAYEWIIRYCEYGLTSEDQNISSVFVDRISCCAGYSRAFQYILSFLELPCVYVTGEAFGAGEGGPHAWNLVFVDDEWCWCDLTWGDPITFGYEKDERSISYDYCGIGDEYLIGITHFPAPELDGILPYCENYNDWYARHWLSFDCYSHDEIAGALQDDVYYREAGFWEKDGFAESALRFTNDAAFDEGVQKIIEENAAFSMLQPAFQQHDREISQMSMSPNYRNRTIHMTYWVQ